jgi:hypothetical protein
MSDDLNSLKEIRGKLLNTWSFINNTYPNITKSSFVSQYMTLLYKNVSINDDQITFFIIFQALDGFGDILMGIKIVQMIKKAFPKSKLVVHCSEIEFVKNKIANHLNIIFHELYDTLYEYYPDYNDMKKTVTNTITKYKLAISLALENDDYYENMKFKQNEISILFVDEYNGWRISEMLKDIKNNANPDDIPFDYVFPTGFGTIENTDILASGITFIDSTRDICNTIDKIEVGLLNKLDSFNFIYSANSKMDDIPLFLDDFKKSDNCSTFVIICKTTTKKMIQTLNNNNGKQKSLKSFSIIDNEYHFYGFKKIVNNRKDMIIYFKPRLSHNSMLKFIKRSLSPILVTGDQSMSEAISFNKDFWYQVMSWKKDLNNKLTEYLKFNGMDNVNNINNVNDSTDKTLTKYSIKTMNIRKKIENDFSMEYHFIPFIKWALSSKSDGKLHSLCYDLLFNFDDKDSIDKILCKYVKFCENTEYNIYRNRKRKLRVDDNNYINEHGDVITNSYRRLKRPKLS